MPRVAAKAAPPTAERIIECAIAGAALAAGEKFNLTMVAQADAIKFGAKVRLSPYNGFGQQRFAITYITSSV